METGKLGNMENVFYLTLCVLHGNLKSKTGSSGTPASFGIPAGQWIGGLVSVLQQLFLEVDNRREHGFVLDFGWWNDDATVHEVGHGICELAGSLGLEGALIEDLERRLRI